MTSLEIGGTVSARHSGCPPSLHASLDPGKLTSLADPKQGQLWTRYGVAVALFSSLR